MEPEKKSDNKKPKLKIDYFFGFIFLLGAILTAILIGFSFSRYYFFILAYIEDYAIWLYIFLFIMFFITLITSISKFKAKKLKRITYPFLILILIISIGSPIFFIHYMETENIKGESNLDKLSSLYDSQTEWEDRVNLIREGILRGAELDPLPTRTNLNVTIHSTRNHGTYIVENVYFESLPGFFVTGNLYRPTDYNLGDPKPIILIPHGHFQYGRFEEIHQQLGATFARMGAVAFTYDMVGKGESTQVDHKIYHAFMLQLWNGIRILDFLTSLENVNSSAIAMTGASGGGTQTFMLAAIDNRINVSVPVCMVSSWMYGGCVCESGMPIHKGLGYATNNAEIAAIAAPRPMLLISSGKDWTRFNPTLEYPYIQRIYQFYNTEQNVENIHFPEEEHGYSYVMRQSAYKFIAKHLYLDISLVQNPDTSIDESVNVIESMNDMLAFDSLHPRPYWALYGEDAIVNALKSLQ